MSGRASLRSVPRARLAAVLAAGVVAAGALWWYGPWNRDLRYSRTDLVSLRLITESHPSDQKAWRQLGLRLAGMGDGQMAEPALRQALALDPRDSMSGTALGEILLTRTDFPGAFQALSNAVAADPNNVYARMALGRLYRRKASYGHAIEQYLPVVAKDPRNGDAWNSLAICYMQTQQVAKARDANDHAIRLDPHDAGYLATRASLEAATGHIDPAVTAMQEAARLAPKDAAMQSNYAALLLAHSRGPADLDEAERAIDRFAALQPDSPQVDYERGKLALLRGDWATARVHLESALRRSPDLDEVYYALSQAYRRLGRETDAQKYLTIYHKRQDLELRMDSVRYALGNDQAKKAPLYVQLADLQAEAGEMSGAFESLQHAAEDDPKLPGLQEKMAAMRKRAEKLYREASAAKGPGQ